MATLILFLSFLLFTVSFSQVISTRSEEEIKLLHEGWLVKHHKNYNGLFEIEKRYNIFKDNLKFIDEHNAGNHSITLGLTGFADLTNDEYRKTYLGFRQPAGWKMTSEESTGYDDFNPIEELPDSLDWRLKGAVVPVKNQGGCRDSSWAFSAIAAVEGLNAIVTGNLISLSEQEIIDCYKKSCGGGLMDHAFEFIMSNGGINTDQDYPYRGRYVGCDKNKLERRVVSIDGYKRISPRFDEVTLKRYVAKQPISVAVEANGRYFQLYKSGIFDEKCGPYFDHGVTVVGYGSESGKDYWLIKNSWGEGWGEKGYIRLRRNIDQPQGKCGITLEASYPVKSSKMNIENPIEDKAVEEISAI